MDLCKIDGIWQHSNSFTSQPIWLSEVSRLCLVHGLLCIDLVELAECLCACDESVASTECLQACDITEGIYLRIPQLGGLLQYLLVSTCVCIVCHTTKRRLKKQVRYCGDTYVEKASKCYCCICQDLCVCNWACVNDLIHALYIIQSLCLPRTSLVRHCAVIKSSQLYHIPKINK